MNQTATGIGISRLGQVAIDHPGSILYFNVPDIKAAYGRMLASGVRFRDEPHLIARMPSHDLWMTFFHDTEGNLLALMSEVPK